MPLEGRQNVRAAKPGAERQAARKSNAALRRGAGMSVNRAGVRNKAAKAAKKPTMGRGKPDMGTQPRVSKRPGRSPGGGGGSVKRKQNNRGGRPGGRGGGPGKKIGGAMQQLPGGGNAGQFQGLSGAQFPQMGIPGQGTPFQTGPGSMQLPPGMNPFGQPGKFQGFNQNQGQMGGKGLQGQLGVKGGQMNGVPGGPMQQTPGMPPNPYNIANPYNQGR